jgi:hypothetical protein
MTVVVAVAAPDGIILAAESRTSVLIGERHRVLSDTAQKVFTVDQQVGVLTYGDAFLGTQTIAGVMDEFAVHVEDEGLDAAEITTKLGEFFDTRLREVTDVATVTAYEQAGATMVGFLAAGYDADAIGRVREVTIPGPSIENETDITTAGGGGASWRGQTDVIRRLVYGFDGDLYATLGVETPDDVTESLSTLRYELLFPITMQDAVDFASFLIRTTIDMQRFSDGTAARPGEIPGCGGPVRILSVTTDGTEWIADARLTLPTRAGWAAEGASAS